LVYLKEYINDAQSHERQSHKTLPNYHSTTTTYCGSFICHLRYSFNRC